MKLYYFDIYGRAEPIRMMLTKAGVAFEDIRATHAMWPEIKESGILEYGQVPMLELEDGTRLVQQTAIQWYLASTYGFAPTAPMDIYKSEHLQSLVFDDFLGKKLIPAMVGPEEARAALVEAWFGGHFETLMGHLDRKLESKFLIGDKIHHIDFSVAGFFLNNVLNPNSALAAQWAAAWEKAPEKVKQYVADFKAEMGDYMDKRPQNHAM